MAKTASHPHMKHIGPDYVAAVIATFQAVVRAGCPAAAEHSAEAEDSQLAAAAVLPLTELLAARGPVEDVPVADWMLKGGASYKLGWHTISLELPVPVSCRRT